MHGKSPKEGFEICYLTLKIRENISFASQVAGHLNNNRAYTSKLRQRHIPPFCLGYNTLRLHRTHNRGVALAFVEPLRHTTMAAIYSRVCIECARRL